MSSSIFYRFCRLSSASASTSRSTFTLCQNCSRTRLGLSRRRLASVAAAHVSLPASEVPNGERIHPALLHNSNAARISTDQYSHEYSRLLAAALLFSKSTLRSASNESGPPSNPGGPPRPEDPEISDQEWEIRTGRAIYILQQTLPDFFATGLVSSMDMPDIRPDPPPSAPTSKWRSWTLPGASWLRLGRKPTANGNGKGKAKEEGADGESIYSPRIKLTYAPPTPLPAPFPQTLALEGLHLYIASSIFVRHTLNALYTDLAVTLQRVRVHGSQESGSLPPGIPPALRPKREGRRARDKSISILLTVNGVGRVSGAPAEWQVNCTYTFSPLTGLIVHHNIDSIEPAPHQALFEALGKFGLLSGSGGGKAGGVGQ